MKAKVSGLISDLSGALGNCVASHNKQGLFLRERVIPRNTYTDARYVVRQRFSSLANKWSTLSEAARNAFSAQSGSYTFYDNLGNAYHPSGWQLFLYVNMNIFPYSSAFITTAVPYSLLSRDPIVGGLFHFNGASWVTASPDLPSVDYIEKVSCSKPYPQSMRYSTVPMRYIGVIDYAHKDGQNLYAPYTAIFPEQKENLTIFQVNYQRVQLSTGLVSIDFKYFMVFLAT